MTNTNSFQFKQEQKQINEDLKQKNASNLKMISKVAADLEATALKFT